MPFLILAHAPFVSASDMAFPCCPFGNQAELPLLLFFRKGRSGKQTLSMELGRKILQVSSFQLNRIMISFLNKKAATGHSNFSNNLLICMMRGITA